MVFQSKIQIFQTFQIYSDSRAILSLDLGFAQQQQDSQQSSSSCEQNSNIDAENTSKLSNPKVRFVAIVVSIVCTGLRDKTRRAQ